MTRQKHISEMVKNNGGPVKPSSAPVEVGMMPGGGDRRRNAGNGDIRRHIGWEYWAVARAIAMVPRPPIAPRESARLYQSRTLREGRYQWICIAQGGESMRSFFPDHRFRPNT